MVFFICSHCGASLKKNKVEKHYAVQCRNAPQVSCMDCHKEFRGNDYVAHTKCITEDEKYSAKGFVPKPNSNKGECKQQEWLEVVRGVQSQENLPKCLKTVLESIVKFENIPRKKPKFLNFLKSNHIKLAPNDLDQLWDLLEKEHKRVKGNFETSATTNKVPETKNEESTVDVDKDSPKQNGDLSVDAIEGEVTPKDKTKKRKRKSKDEATDLNEKETDKSLQAAETHNETPMDVNQECEDTTNSNKKKKKKNKTEALDGSETQENENIQVADEENKSSSVDVTSEVTPKEKMKKKKENKKENQTEVTDDIERQGSENIQVTEKKNETLPVEVSEESGTTPKRKTKDNKNESVTEVVENSETQVPEGQQEVILTKKQKKEKKKREKYEAELKEIENSQFNNQPLENDDGVDGRNKKKKKSKKDKDMNGLDSNLNSVTGAQAVEMSIKSKKKRHLDDDQSAEPLKKKKKKEQEGDEPVEEMCAVESFTAESAATLNTNGLQKFKWNEAILEVLQSKGGEIPVKRLRKKIVAEYQNSCGSAESEDKLIVKFNKKLSKVPGVIVHKEVVKLLE